MTLGKTSQVVAESPFQEVRREHMLDELTYSDLVKIQSTGEAKHDDSIRTEEVDSVSILSEPKSKVFQ